MVLREPDEVSTDHLLRSALALRRRYILALLLLALLAVVGGFLLREVIRRHRAISAHVMQVLTQHRTLSQALGAASLALTTADTPQRREAYRSEIRSALDKGRDSHRALVQSELMRDVAAREHAQARLHLSQLEPHYEAMASAAERLLALTQSEPYPDSKQLMDVVDPVLTHGRPYRDAMDLLTADFVREAAARDEAAEDAGLGVTAALLILLTLEGLLIFRPVLAQLERSIADLARAWTEVKRGERERKAMLSALPDLLLRYDRHGAYLDGYATSSEISKGVQEALRGRSLDSLVPPSQTASMLGSLTQVLARGGVERIDCVLPGTEHKADGPGEEPHAELRLVALGPEEVLVLVRDVTAQRRIERSVLEVVETEQQRIGRELHDGVCQSMAGLSLLTRSLVREAERAPIGAPQLDALARLLEPCVVEARRIARGLVPMELTSHGLAVALQRLTEDMATRHRLPIECEVSLGGSDSAYKPSAEVAHQLYRIAQEAMSSAIQNGPPRTISLRLSIEDREVIDPIHPSEVGADRPIRSETQAGSAQRELVLCVQDSGAQSSRDSIKPRVAEPHALGLQTMAYRARCIGGYLLVDRLPDGGTYVRCRLPLTST